MEWRNVLPKQWNVMTFYQRFESVVALVMTLLVMAVIVVAIFRLTLGVLNDLIFGALNPLNHRIFQNIFGEIMTVLIALEFNHTLQYVVTRQQSIIQTKIIILIALLAVARKFIILDLTETTPEVMFALAAIALALGVVYWLVRDRSSISIPER
jgi:uncharacterized membrane protein (DUF373 family)